MDSDQNFAFTQKSEVIAFNDSLIIPRMEERLRMDTAWVDSLTYDTIVEKKYMHYLPDDVILRAFKELNYSQYLIKSERLVPQKFTFYFAGKADTLPVLKGSSSRCRSHCYEWYARSKYEGARSWNYLY